ncbi:hypothetical protein EFD56_27860 [Rhizobium phaseoli]|nr:hypothetical protein EFD56_27860 [Rhizobium phaseoli]
MPVYSAIIIALITGASGFAAGGYTTTFEYFTGKLVKSETMEVETKRAEKAELAHSTVLASLRTTQGDLEKALADLKTARVDLSEAQAVIATNNRGAQRHTIPSGGSYKFPGTDLELKVTSFSAAGENWSATLQSGDEDYSVTNHQPTTTILTKNHLNCDVAIVGTVGPNLKTSADCKAAQ